MKRYIPVTGNVTVTPPEYRVQSTEKTEKKKDVVGLCGMRTVPHEQPGTPPYGNDFSVKPRGWRSENGNGRRANSNAQPLSALLTIPPNPRG